ncbi:hypothetical protein HX823_25715 [Pseudomonas sp. P7759]|uniref:hypothetical protein n=1 Tax=Pseudomonas sp. P7759 TaxID=2738831 RepID=UPI0015A2BDEB|nr:hypothetical protein [Pseudomonas sp. P7759]NWC77478.1 hypothetical protein [Pseudomonas sp. P7759]
MSLSDEVYAQIGAFNVSPSNLENGNGFKRNAQTPNAASGMGYDDAGYVPEQHCMPLAVHPVVPTAMGRWF